MFVIFFAVLAALAALSVADSRSTTADAVSTSLRRAGRDLSMVEMNRQGANAFPLR